MIDGTQHIIKHLKEMTALVTSALSQDTKLEENIKLHLKSLKQATVPMWLSQKKGQGTPERNSSQHFQTLAVHPQVFNLGVLLWNTILLSEGSSALFLCS